MIKDETYQRYEGEALKEPSPLIRYRTKTYKGKVREGQKTIEELIPSYFPSEELKQAVEYARLLNRPLLLRGEPGCGKTRLAQAVAYELYGEKYRERYFEWHVKSTTKAREGLYAFDHLARLRDVELLRRQGAAPTEKEDADTKLNYRAFGPLGKAFITSKKGAPSILLIDEIDKADLDFPNDLLLELDQKRFYIEETNEEVIAERAPIIFITSNDEKELPDAFLRRCVFHYINFPGPELLLRIARANAERLAEEYEKEVMPDKLVESIVQRFDALYQEMNGRQETDKAPSTSELIDWLRIHYFNYLKGELTEDKILKGKLLHPEVLLKSLDDYKSQMHKKEDGDNRA